MLAKITQPARKDGSRLVSDHSFSRRHLLGGAAALSLGALPFGRARAAGPLTVGFIYVGPKDDYGYNQAHAQGAAALKAIPGVQVVEEENVRETTDVQKTMESMINLDGASLVFPTSFGYFDPHVLIEAKKNPKVQFSVAPQNTLGLAQFLHQVGAIRKKPESWRDYFFTHPALDKGS